MKLFRTAVALTLIASFASWSHAALIPAERLVDWTPGVSVGVPGGIPTNRTRLIDVTQSPYSADKTGSADATAAIQAAVDAAVSGDVVYLPAGTYRVDGRIMIGPGKSNISLRGAGMGATTIDYRGNNVFLYVGSGSDYQWNYPSSGNVVTAGLAKGSTVISIANTSAFSAGQMIQIAVENQNNNASITAGAAPVLHVNGYPFARHQMTKIVSKTASTLTVSPAIYWTPDAGLSAQVHVAQSQANGVGIEDLAIDGANGRMLYAMFFEQAYSCWVKGVKVRNVANYGMFFLSSLNCEVRKCYIADRNATAGPNGAGILCGSVAGCLFEDNIILRLFPAIEVNFSSMGNVFAYNLLENSTGGTLNTNHGPHNSFNLYEGNITPNLQCDGYFGSASDDTVFRNWIHGTDVTRTLRTIFLVNLNRFTRNYSLVGNIIGESGTPAGSPVYLFGQPNIGNWTSTGVAKPSLTNFWRDWKITAALTVRLSDTSGSILLASGGLSPGQDCSLVWNNDTKRAQITVASVVGNLVTFTNAVGDALPALSNVSVYPGPYGYQEIDQDVERTTLLKGNYNFVSSSIPSNEGLGTETLPNSLYRSSKPGFFGNLAWPAFNPLNPAPSFTSIPAGYRYVNGSDAPGITTDSNPAGAPAAPSNLRVR